MDLSLAVEADSDAIVAMMAAVGVSALAADAVLRWGHRRLVPWPVER